MAQIGRNEKTVPPVPLLETMNAARLMGFQSNTLIEMRMRDNGPPLSGWGAASATGSAISNGSSNSAGSRMRANTVLRRDSDRSSRSLYVRRSRPGHQTAAPSGRR